MATDLAEKIRLLAEAFAAAGVEIWREEVELYAAEMSAAKAAGFETARDLFTAYQVLEKKLAEKQAAIAQYGLEAVAMCGAEELAKQLAVAEQRGFENGVVASNADLCKQTFAEGKQAGRDEVLTELSEQEPIAWKFEEAVPAYANEKGTCTTPSNKRLLSFAAPDFTYSNIHHVVKLIPRPIKPTKE